MAAYLPLVLFGGVIAVAPKVYKRFQQDATKPEESVTLESQHLAQMKKHGALAGPWKNAMDRFHHQGGIADDASGVAYFDIQNGGYNPNGNVNPLEAIWAEHAALQTRDRLHSSNSLLARRSKVVPRRRNPIATTLTGELTHPTQPHRKTAFLASSLAPAYANNEMINRAAQEAAAYGITDMHVRTPGIALYNKAHGQSFRYGDN